MTVIDLVIARLTNPHSPSYEGWRADVYDDVTGKPVVTQGQPTVGYGCRVRQWSQGLGECVLRYQLQEFLEEIDTMPWFTGTDNQKSVLLEIAFNQGFIGLLRYPHMLGYCAAGNFTAAASECTIGDVKLKPRYAALAEILRAG